MKIWLAAIGRSRPGPVRDLFEDYAGRLAWPFTLREVEVRKRLPAEELKRREAALLLGAVPADARVVALDEKGRNLASGDFAACLGGWRDAGAPAVAFLIGGADGHGAEIAARADLVLALGAMTWPHMMVRAMLMEQVYRAQQILAGHPYHRA